MNKKPGFSGIHGLSDTLNSPQGDGNWAYRKGRIQSQNRQTPSIPRKGTETIYAQGHKDYMQASDTLNSPQGDGNPGKKFNLLLPRPSQTPSIPRKGTETSL